MTKINYSVITSPEDYTKKLRSLSNRGGSVKTDFVAFITATVPYFWGEGNFQIDLINRLVKVAYDNGYNGGHTLDYLRNVIPWSTGKDKENPHRFLFTTKDKKNSLTQDDVMAFLASNPSPFELEKGGNTEPKDFDAEKRIVGFLKAAKKAGLELNAVEKLLHQKGKEVFSEKAA